ncbi:winged helix-turn-helix domain-containing protein [Piscinibacter sp.]|uniref:winged helix-turn-helix domain-containing protein n=1 Tax=Piscinibacter sp. TaxID=1903157 RepID=UPI002BC72F00|nr:winged helix-turn-helix domain-containing protein [Albitalea sp.]HUG24315.1 winged helix-turn-helix domain-containing protein [Albitalea sp.]
MSPPPRCAFGDFVIERAQQRVLRRDGSTLNLPPRLFKALLLFVDNAGQLLDKDTFMSALWPGLVVDDNSLSQVISGLRRALADDGTGSLFIQTVPRCGFRFVVPVHVLTDDDLPPPPAASRIGAPARPVPAAAPLSSETALAPVIVQIPATGPVPASPAEPTAPPQPLPPPPAPPLRVHRRAALAGVTATAVAAATGVGLWAWRRPAPPGPGGPPFTLAVLPFKPLVAEGRDELLEVGMADSLIAQLSTLPGVVVRSIGSVRRHAGSEQDPLRIARELDVAWVVDGALQRRGDELRVSARLLRVADGSAAWSGSFDQKFTGVFEVQDAIATRVAQMLAPRLGAYEPANGAAPLAGRGGTRNTDAYQLYLAAGRHAQDMRADGLGKSIALYQQALRVDPRYALAWVGLAEAHRRTLFGADALPAQVFEPVALAIQRALAAAPGLAEARTEAAFKMYWYDFDWPGAEREFRLALAANPNVAMARFGLASLLLNQDQVDEGLVQLRTARELDPLSPVLNTLEAAYLLEAGRVPQARARLDRALDIAPRFWLAHSVRGLLHLAAGDNAAGISQLRRAVELADGNSRPTALLATYLARLGHDAEARALLGQLESRSRQRYVPPSSLAAVHTALGDTAAALAALERAFDTRDTRLTFLKDDPRLAPLRSEPRFGALLRKLKMDHFGRGLAPL